MENNKSQVAGDSTLDVTLQGIQAEDTDPSPQKSPKQSKGRLAAVIVVAAVLVIGAVVALARQTPPKVPVNQSITIMWAQWKPSDYLQTLTKDFTKETGIEVKVVQEPWGNFQNKFFAEMAKKGQSYDMVVGDSQWLGKGSSNGDYVELTDWVKQHNIEATSAAVALKGLAEYPKESGHFWAYPLEGDALGFSYRKDLFQDPAEKAAFKARYGYELAVPKTWAQFRDISEYFNHPEKGFYGAALLSETSYDSMTMSIDPLLYAWGASIGDLKTYHVKGILNSKEGVEALKFRKSLYAFTNPAWKDLDPSKIDGPMVEGKVAMSHGYFAISPDILDATKNSNAKNIGYFSAPSGPVSRAASLGGQGLSIVSYSHKKDLSLKFLDWIAKDATQAQFASLGGLSTNKKVLASDKFLNARPSNKAYVESTEMMKDFWTVPEYSQLLAISQKYWGQYVTTNTITAEQAMDNVAKEWEQVFETAGYYKQ